ncbi:MAG TPA: hypothetical protein VM286_04320 [Candidatus Thermoplasmatota archaeon]|nr:hypothetical protein [Candidatus Thermoplasmatota archaeon]
MVEPRFVQCVECGNRFDAAQMGFCSRCGAVAPAPGTPGALAGASAAPALARRDPLRRRPQVGGILLTTLGALLLASCIGFYVLAGAVLGEALGQVVASQGDAPIRGGTLSIHVLDNGTAAANATVELRSPAGTLFYSNQTVGGWANATLGDHAAANITVRAGGHILERRALVLEGDAQDLTLDVSRDAAQDAAWIGMDRLVSFVRIAVGVIAAAALALLLGGIAAVMLRWLPLAIAGPIPALALTLLLVVATLNVGMLVIFLLQAVGLALVVSGRRAFRRRSGN